MQYFVFLIAIIIILAGIRTVFTRQATLHINLWGSGSRDPHDNYGTSVSEHSGFMAILIGLGEIATGIAILVEGPAYIG